MGEQLTLEPLITDEGKEKFDRWLAKNPKVFALFERFALERLRQGRRFGIAALLERVRWEVPTTWGLDEDGYKIGNNLKPYIARELIRRYPQLEPLIEIRQTKAERAAEKAAED